MLSVPAQALCPSLSSRPVPGAAHEDRFRSQHGPRTGREGAAGVVRWLVRFAWAGGLAALLAACAPSKHLYVAPDGNDSNSGSKSAPFSTIARADAAAAPGFTIHVAPGTYEVSAPGLLSAGITTQRSGTASERIKFVSDVK